MHPILVAILKAASRKVLLKLADRLGEKVDEMMDIEKMRKKLVKKALKEQKQIKKDMNKVRNRWEEISAEDLKVINNARDELGSVREVNQYLNKSSGEFNSLAELNEVMSDYKNVKGKLTRNQLQKVIKQNGYSTKEYMSMMKEKIARFDLESYRPMLKYYGFKDEEIDKMKEEFNKANYKRKDHFLKILNDFAKGKNRYQESDYDLDHVVSRSNFTSHFDNVIKGGLDFSGNKIDEQ